jgi:anti-sigma factor RsiW
MNTPSSPLTPATPEERLSAWLDGELPPDQAAEVDAWLAARPDEAARVRLWAADRDALRARLGPQVADPVPDALAQAVWNAAPARPGAWRWAAAVAVFALGGVVGAGLAWRFHVSHHAGPVVATAPAGWVTRAAVAHAVYVPEQRHPVEVAVAAATPEESRAQEEHLVRWLTKRLGFPVKLFDLRQRGFELVGGRLLPDATGPSAQLMYQAVAGGARVTVYLKKPDAATDFAFRYEREGDLGLFYSVEGGVGYAVAGSLPREQLLAVAESIHHQQVASEAVPASAPK